MAWPCLSEVPPGPCDAVPVSSTCTCPIGASAGQCRVFVTIGAAALFWIITEWPSGVEAITWAAIPVILFSPRADQAYAGATGFVVGSGVATVAAAIVAFAVLPNLGTFAAFSLATGCWLVPTDATAHRWQRVAFTYMAAYSCRSWGPRS